MFVIDGARPLQVSGRVAEMLIMLMQGPVAAPNVKRHSDSVFKLRAAGVDVWTERVRRADSVIGIYHLRSNVRRVSKAEFDLRVAAALAKAKSRKAVEK